MITQTLSTDARVLEVLLQRGPRSWSELAQASLSARAVHDAAAELRTQGVQLHLGVDGVSLIRPTLSALASDLLGRLRRGPRLWSDLEAEGVSRIAALAAAGELVLSGLCRVRLGPLLVELETGPDDEEVPV